MTGSIGLAGQSSVLEHTDSVKSSGSEQRSIPSALDPW